MNVNSNLIGLMIDELPGLVGALQPLSGGTQNLSELARRQQRQNVANAMLAAASGLLTPSPNRYPLGPLQRLGVGLGAALRSYNDGAAQGRIINALEMGGRGAQSRAGATAPAALTGAEPTRAANTMSVSAAPEVAATESAVSDRRAALAPRRIAGRTSDATPKAASGRATLRKFNGTLARRLEHPAVLPGGWKLYGYAKEGGSPVYVGPDAELRIYA